MLDITHSGHNSPYQTMVYRHYITVWSTHTGLGPWAGKEEGGYDSISTEADFSEHFEHSNIV